MQKYRRSQSIANVIGKILIQRCMYKMLLTSRTRNILYKATYHTIQSQWNGPTMWDRDTSRLELLQRMKCGKSYQKNKCSDGIQRAAFNAFLFDNCAGRNETSLVYLTVFNTL